MFLHVLHVFHANVNVNLMEENVIEIKSEIMINVNAGVKASYM